MSKSSLIQMNSTSSRFRLARTFLRSLSKIKSQRRTTAAATAAVSPSARRIKLAAYSSMARAAGPRRAWARALLFKLQTRARHRVLMSHHRRHGHGHRNSSNDDQVGRLRRVVPGGGAMDVCTLLEETAHYIHCLSTQVKVMKAISHHFSSN